MYSSRTPPANVRRQLRQEAGFGCVVCGCPIIEYHHIVPWEERKHFEPENMVVLCPNHHTEYGKLRREKSYFAKMHPRNLSNGLVHGFLGGNKTHKGVRCGSFLFDYSSVYPFHFSVSVLNYCGISLLSYRLESGQFEISAFLPDQKFWPEIKIVESEMIARTTEFWDIEFKTSWVKFTREKGDVFLSVDFREEYVEIDGNIEVGGEKISLSDGKSSIGGSKFEEVHITGATAGIRLGPKGRIILPNYAMKVPVARFIPAQA